MKPSPTHEVAGAEEEAAAAFHAKVQPEPGGFLPNVAVVGRGREAQAGDSARGQGPRIKLSASNPGKLRQIHASRALLSARQGANSRQESRQN